MRKLQDLVSSPSAFANSIEPGPSEKVPENLPLVVMLSQTHEPVQVKAGGVQNVPGVHWVHFNRPSTVELAKPALQRQASNPELPGSEVLFAPQSRQRWEDDALSVASGF